jgi:hypothetical protein
LREPGIGTIHGFCASSQASAILRRRSALLAADARQQVDHRAVGLDRLLGEARVAAADVVLAKVVLSSILPVR